MSKLHKNHNREGPFQPSCDMCYKTYFIDSLKTGCTHHRYDPHLLNGGNPRNAMIVEESLKLYKNPHYQVKSDTPLSPVELKSLFDSLIVSWNIYKLQFWVMVLLSIHLFLRGDETVELGFFSVIEDLTTYSDNGTIASLMIEVYGKIEKKTETCHVSVVCQ